MTTIQMQEMQEQETQASTIIAEKFLTKEQYLTVKETWSSKKEHSAADIVTYNLLRSVNIAKGFTPISPTNIQKIESNCNDAWFGFNNAKNIAYGNVMVVTNKWRSEEENKALTDAHIAKFKEKFGIDLTDAIREALRGIGNKK